MLEYKIEVGRLQNIAEALLKERGDILRQEKDLTATAVDRLFEISTEVDTCFEQQSMLLPLLEEKETQDRWNSGNR